MLIYDCTRGSRPSLDFLREFDERQIVKSGHFFYSRLRAETGSVKGCPAMPTKAVDDYEEGRENWVGSRCAIRPFFIAQDWKTSGKLRHHAKAHSLCVPVCGIDCGGAWDCAAA